MLRVVRSGDLDKRQFKQLARGLIAVLVPGVAAAPGHADRDVAPAPDERRVREVGPGGLAAVRYGRHLLHVQARNLNHPPEQVTQLPVPVSASVSARATS